MRDKRGMDGSVIQTRDLVLLGGGHTHALVLKRWGMGPLAGARVTVINPSPGAAYSGMLPGFVAGHYTRDELDIDLVRLARFAGARVVLGAASGVDRLRREVIVPGRPPIAYDVLSIDVGLTSDMPDLPGFSDHGIGAKPLGPFARAWAEARGDDGPIVVIGGGVAGIELALAMAHARAGRGSVTVIEAGQILSVLPPRPRARMLVAIDKLGVKVIEGARPVRVTENAVELDDGRAIPARFVTGAAGGHAWPWQADLGLDLQDGFIKVNAQLQTSDPAIFATGDCAHMTASPRPKAGVFAVRQAPVLHHNLRAALSGRPMKDYRPQKDYLKLVSLGGKRALAEKRGLPYAGPLMWRWKDHIDQSFMRRLNDLTPMKLPAPPRVRALGEQPEGALCTGCGAKVGRDALRAALPTGGLRRDDVHVPAGDDAAVLTMQGQQQVITTDHLAAVTEDPWLMGRIAAIHALGDIWAMGAEPQAALAQVVLPRMAPELQQRTLAEIMAGAEAEFTAAGAQIAGGHTTQGAGLTVGFSVTGLLYRDPITLAGARAGDSLILTKPLGTGVNLAGEMQLRARGSEVSATLDSMVQSQVAAANLLRDVAHAMTDVTGFGLAGHLEAMMRASGTSARIVLAQVPVLPGVHRLSAEGVASVLMPENRALAPGIEDLPETRVLFDPQTCGGLLAAVPSNRAVELIHDLKKEGYPAGIIGDVEGSGDILRIT